MPGRASPGRTAHGASHAAGLRRSTCDPCCMQASPSSSPTRAAPRSRCTRPSTARNRCCWAPTSPRRRPSRRSPTPRRGSWPRKACMSEPQMAEPRRRTRLACRFWAVSASRLVSAVEEALCCGGGTRRGRWSRSGGLGGRDDGARRRPCAPCAASARPGMLEARARARARAQRARAASAPITGPSSSPPSGSGSPRSAPSPRASSPRAQRPATSRASTPSAATGRRTARAAMPRARRGFPSRPGAGTTTPHSALARPPGARRAPPPAAGIGPLHPPKDTFTTR